MNRHQRQYTVEESGAFVETLRVEPIRPGPLSGLRFGVKDLIDIAGHRTGCGNPDWRATHSNAVVNAVCVDQLLSAGAECAGKTVTDELAFSLDGENHFNGTPLNPRAPDRVPGGSSSGSASAVACGLVDFALGTDTGGSIRVPASNCGIWGIRPSHDVISLAGVMPFAPSFDTVGILAASLDVLQESASVLLGCDPPPDAAVETVHLLREPLGISDPEVRNALTAPIGALQRLFKDRVRDTSAADMVGEKAGASLPLWNETFCTLQWAEIWSSLGAWVEETNPRFGPRTEQNFASARSLDRKAIGAAIQTRERYCRRLDSFLGPHDLLCMPTVPAIAPLKNSLGNDRTSGHYYPRVLSMTSIAGIGRLPQIALPLADIEGVPIGLSLLARHGQDAFLLRVAQMITRHVQ